MTFNIEPLEIIQTAVKLSFNVISVNDSTAVIYYELFRADGRIAEKGNREIPIQALQILGQVPLDIANLNLILAGFEITAIDQIFPEQTES